MRDEQTKMIELEVAMGAVCQFCREGRGVDENNDHVLAWIEGHVSQAVRCSATALRDLPTQCDTLRHAREMEDRVAQRDAEIARLEAHIRKLNYGKGTSITGQEAEAMRQRVARLRVALREFRRCDVAHLPPYWRCGDCRSCVRVNTVLAGEEAADG
jgi:hypothetical protein